MSSYLIFTGPLNDFLLVTFIYFLNLIFIPTALLICIENTCWNINGHGSFVELFKKSFTLYVESGMREMTERDLEILKNEQDPSRDEFNKFIVNHYLRKFHSSRFYLHLSSNHCLRLLNTSRDDGESANRESQGSDSDPKKKFTWLRKLLLKFRRKQRAWWVLILNSIRSWRDKTLTLWRDTVVNRHQKLENLHFYGYYNFSYTQAGVTERLGRLNLWMEIQDYYKWCLHAIYCNVEDVRIQLGFRRVAFQVFYGEAMSLSDIASLFINFLKILY